jgi:predicted ester cyclase
VSRRTERRLVATDRAGFPDQGFAIEDMVAWGEKVVIRFNISATHESELLVIL